MNAPMIGQAALSKASPRVSEQVLCPPIPWSQARKRAAQRRSPVAAPPHLGGAARRSGGASHVALLLLVSALLDEPIPIQSRPLPRPGHRLDRRDQVAHATRELGLHA